MKTFKAFTLAEVLITLGIIGIVASMTLPALIQKQFNKKVETKLKKVYSVMNQAITQAETVYGPKEYWDFSDPEFVNKYYAPYINKVNIKNFSTKNNNYKSIYFADGSLLVFKSSNYINEDGSIKNNTGMNQDYFFFPEAKNFDITTFANRSCCGITCFAFRFVVNSNYKAERGKAFEPYKHSLNEVSDEILRQHRNYGCGTGNNSFCTALIQYNNWIIPDNYPFKVK